MFVTLFRTSILPLLASIGIAVSVQAASPELSRLGVDSWHARGFTGRGVTVAILDNGFHGYRAHLGKALPTAVRTKSFRFDSNLEAKDSSHGVLCAEVMHAIAPDAEILLANWEPDRPETYLCAVKWARDQGAKIISCSIVVPGWSDGYGGGDVHRQLTSALDGMLLFASAGNLAQRHWNGEYHGNAVNQHQWTSGRAENGLFPWGDQPVSVEITSAAAAAYRLSVLDSAGRSVGRARPLAASGAHGSSVRFVPEFGARYRVTVELIEGKSSPFRLLVLGGDLEIATPGGCMVFPGDGAEVVAVGAVSANGIRLASSCTGIAGQRLKPDLVAPVPFPSHWRSAPFGGTSAAAPQAAGVAALIWSRQTAADASRILQIMRANCVDIAPPGPDCETGHGQIKLPPP